MRGSTARLRRTMPKKLASKRRCASAVAVNSMAPEMPKPALFTRMSSRPSASATCRIAAANCDGITVPEGFEGGAALDFASALWCWSIFHLTVSLKWVGAIGAGLLALGMCAVNFVRIRRAK